MALTWDDAGFRWACPRVKRAVPAAFQGGLALPAGVCVGDGQAEGFELGDEGAEPPLVVEPLLVVGELVIGEQPGDGLAGDLAGPLVVGAVQHGRVGVAVAVGPAAPGEPLGEGTGQDEADAGELAGDALGSCLLAPGWRHALMVASGVPRFRHILQYKCCTTELVMAGYTASWQPSSVSPRASSFARQVVTAAGPHGRERAKNLLWAAGKLADYGIGLGLEPAPGVLLHPSVIERFTAHAPGLTGVTRRTPRTNLRFLARAVVPQLHPRDAPLPRERAKAPYTAAQIDGYLALAAAQPAATRRMRAAGLVCPGAGAGLIRAGLRAVRGTDVICRSGGVIVTVAGSRPRAVPALARYHDILLESARFAGDHLVTGGTGPARRNVTSPLARSLAGGTGLPALEGSRLRATWLADCAQILGLATFLHAAGITCSQRLGDITAALRPGGETGAVALLGGTSR